MINKKKTILLSFCLFVLLSNFCFVFAANVEFVPQIGIPDSEFEAGTKVLISGRSFIDYLRAIYNWSVGAIAVIAIIMIMIAGFQWMAAAGNPSAIGQARSRISSSLIGLLLAIGAYAILNFVNPSLVYLRTLDIGNVELIELNLSEEKCTEDGLTEYDWSDFYYCFDMRKNQDFKQNYQADGDMGIIESIEKDDIDHIEITLGLREDHLKDCGIKDNFKAMGGTLLVAGKLYDFKINAESEGCKSGAFSIPWSACIINGAESNRNTSVSPKQNLLGHIADHQNAILAQVQFNSSDIFTGLKVQAASKDSRSSALFTKVKVVTYSSCTICCGSDSGDVMFYDFGPECRSESKVAMQKCNDEYCAEYREDMSKCKNIFDKRFCIGLQQNCLYSCQWDHLSGKCFPAY